MNVNSSAFKSKCRFKAVLRYELFLSLSAAAVRYPKELHGLKQWREDIVQFMRPLRPALRTGLELSTVVPSFFPPDNPSIKAEEIFTHLENLKNEDFTYLFLEGLLHDKEICKALVARKVSFQKGINSIGQKKREWLSHIHLYPYDPTDPHIQFFEWLLNEGSSAQQELLDLYRNWWMSVFSKFWNSKREFLQNSAKLHQTLLNDLNFEELSNKILLKIKTGKKGDSIEALRGGYEISCSDIDHVYFTPSVFNLDRLWSAIERPREPKVVYFPYVDLELLQELGQPVHTSTLDAAFMCRALGDPTRFAILTMLSKEPLAAVALAEKLHLTRATISHHVSALRESGVLSDDGKGRQLRVNWENLAALSDILVKSLQKRK